jgi:hypothetical protein
MSGGPYIDGGRSRTLELVVFLCTTSSTAFLSGFLLHSFCLVELDHLLDAGFLTGVSSPAATRHAGGSPIHPSATRIDDERGALRKSGRKGRDRRTHGRNRIPHYICLRARFTSTMLLSSQPNPSMSTVIP